jgi:hydroxymethylglutaryl-CoA reductase (NADPH)
MQKDPRLKNRGYARPDVDERRSAVEEFSGIDLAAINDYTFDPECASKNIENMIGVTQIPLGFVGPMIVNGDYAQGEFIIPMATTEGALLASVSRGMSVITAAGGSHTKVYFDSMTRAPVFRVDGIDHAEEVMRWISENNQAMTDAVSETTTHGKLVNIEPFPNGRNLYLRFVYDTGDAMGMNMATIATESACRIIEENTGAKLISVSGNMCTDKKPAAINMLMGRGKSVVAEVRIPASLVEEKLHTTTAAIVETNYRKNLVGSSMAVSLGSNAHAANMVAAVFLATGQDPAQVIGGSMTITSCEDVDGDLYICVRMPSIEVGTVGGGTRLPTQAAALEIMGCLGSGKAKKFAEIVASSVLAGELSTLAAQAAGHLGKAHFELGR